MILIMFEDDYQYLPSLREIKESLIKAQNRNLDLEKNEWSDKTRFHLLKDIYRENWEKLFDINELGDLEKSLTPDILSNPNHAITQHILYLYSMESFIYTDLNRACRDQDEEEIPYYGAFAAALSYILYNANANRSCTNKINGKSTLYRGLKMSQLEIDTYVVGSRQNLTGYISSSLDRLAAMRFAIEDVQGDQIPVLFEISFDGDKGLFQMSEGYSAYPDECEVLIQDGLQYRVVSNSREVFLNRNNSQEYQLIRLRYPPKTVKGIRDDNSAILTTMVSQDE